MATTIPSPVAQWVEAPDSGAASLLARLAPYLTPAGYWVLLPLTTMAPAGYVRGALRDTGTYAVLDSSTITGLRITRRPVGSLLIY